MAKATRITDRVFPLEDVVGSALWIASGLALGMVSHRAIFDLLCGLGRYAAVVLVVIFGGFAAFIVFKMLRRR